MQKSFAPWLNSTLKGIRLQRVQLPFKKVINILSKHDIWFDCPNFNVDIIWLWCKNKRILALNAAKTHQREAISYCDYQVFLNLATAIFDEVSNFPRNEIIPQSHLLLATSANHQIHMNRSHAIISLASSIIISSVLHFQIHVIVRQQALALLWAFVFPNFHAGRAM